jgi:hypothetical protein
VSSPRNRKYVAAVLLIAIATLAACAWAVVGLVERFYSDNSELRELAVALVPPGAHVVLEEPSECSRSGWARVFTFRDTCHEVRFAAPRWSPADVSPQVETLAATSGWNVVARHASGALDLVRPRYRAYVRPRSQDDVDSCLESSPETPGFCYHSISVVEDD